MSKFDVYKFLLEQIVNGEEENEENINQSSGPDQNQVSGVKNQGQKSGQQMPELSPSQVNNLAGQSKNVFREIIGSTISDISFEPVGNAGGKITLKVSNSHIPLVISWVNQKVSVQQPNGTVVVLSDE